MKKNSKEEITTINNGSTSGKIVLGIKLLDFESDKINILDYKKQTL